MQPWSRPGLDIEYSTLCFARSKSNETLVKSKETLNLLGYKEFENMRFFC